jgi:hypothetical protein
MPNRATSLLVCLLLASTASAETIYKYRRADGQTIYSNRLIPGAELIETFEYREKPAAPRAARPEASKADAAGEERVKQYLAALDKAWREVQDASKALASAEARLSAGVALVEGEGRSLAAPAVPASPAVGGPQAPAAPVAGGPPAAAPPAAGGPMGSRRGGGRSADYADRMAALESDVRAARSRLDAALRAYNQLR